MILTLLILSFFLFALFRTRGNILKNPSLLDLAFIRDYVLLAMVPYYMFYSNNTYKYHYILRAITDANVIQIAAFRATLFIVVFVLFYKFFNVSIFNKRVEKRYHFKVASYYKLLKAFSVLLTIYVVASTYIFKAGIFGLLLNDAFGLDIRRAILSQSGGFLAFNKIVIKFWVPIIGYTWYYLFRINKSDRSLKVWFRIYLILSINSAIFFFEKSGIVALFFGYLAVYLMTGGRLKVRTVLMLIAGGLGSIILMYIVVYQSRIVDNDYLYNIIFARTLTQSVGSIMSVEYFSTHDVVGVAGISDMWASLVGEDFQSPYGMLIDYYVPETKQTSGSLSSFAAGEAYGLFGYFGVVFGGALTALYYSFFSFTARNRSLAFFGIGNYAIFFGNIYLASGFYSFMWPVGLIFNNIPLILIWLLCQRK